MAQPAVLPPDPALPGLTLALDRDAFTAELERALPECRTGECRPVELSHVDVQYSPGKAATLLVKLKLEQRDTSRLVRATLFVSVTPPGEPQPELPEHVLEAYEERRRRDARRLAPLSKPVIDLGAGVRVHAFPIDPRLTTLGDVLDPEDMREALHRAWQPRRVRVRRVRAKLLSYTPQSRAAVRYEVLCESKDTGLPEVRRLVGKLQLRKSPARLFAGHWAVWKETFGRVSIVPPVGYVATAGLSLQEFLEGGRLSDLAGTGAFIGGAREAARGIAHVNALRLPVPSSRDVAREVRTLERWVGVLSRLRPDLAPRLARHGSRLERELRRRFRASGTVHSDFHLANVMVDDDETTLIDWDQVAVGDPALDPARFLGALRVAGLRVAGRHDALAEAGEAFLETWTQASGIGARHVRLFESLALLIAAASPFRLQREGWEEHAEQLVTESEHVLELSTRGAAIAVPDGDDGTEAPPLAQRRRWATDPVFAQSVLVPFVRERHGEDVEVTECAPSVLAENDELLQVRWSLKGWRGDARWRGCVEGTGIAGHGGGAVARRLRAAREALEAAADAGGATGALELPAPLGHLHPLAMVAVERREGRFLSRLVGSAEEAEALERVGRALGALARVPVELDKRRGFEREADVVVRRVESLAERAHPVASRLEELLSETRRRSPGVGGPDFATPHPLQVRDVVLGEQGVGLRVVRDVVSAPAGAAVAALLSRLALSALRPGGPRQAAARLREAFCEAAELPASAVAPLEAILILRRATGRLLDNPKDRRAVALVESAGKVLEEAGGDRASASPSSST